jgi:hypothetical protein
MSNEPEPLEFLKAVYLNEGLPLAVRMRAAIEAAPYVPPKLSAIATTSLTSRDFAAMLDRAILRSQGNGRNVLRSNSARSPTMADDRKPPLRLVSNRTKGRDFESFDRFIAQRPRDRPRALAPWKPKRRSRRR